MACLRHLISHGSKIGPLSLITSCPHSFPITCHGLDFPYYQPVRNAGHSKWANIKHTKAAKDGERADKTSKFVTILKLAVKEGGSADPKLNSKLSQVLAQIKEQKLPMAVFEKALQREMDRKDEKSQILLFKGPGSCVLVTEIRSPSLLKTKQELNTVLRKNKGIIAEDSLIRQFEHKGIIISTELDGKPASEDNLENVIADAIEAGANDVIFNEEHPDFGKVYEFSTEPSSFFRVKHALEKLKYSVAFGDVEYVPANPIELDDADIDDALKLYQKLTQHPNVVKVVTNIA